MTDDNGFRITTRHVFDEIRGLRNEVQAQLRILQDLVIEARGERRSLATQVRILWTLYGFMATAALTVAVRGLLA